MQPLLHVSPTLMNWTSKSWPAVLWSVGSKTVLKFAHVRTTRLTSVEKRSGCAAYGHTLWACVNSTEAIGLGWDWALLDYPPNCLLVADVLSVTSNLRFVDEVMERYLSAHRTAAHLNRMVAALDWHDEVARQAGLALDVC